MQDKRTRWGTFGLSLNALFGLYLLAAWASYSPLDQAWSVANNITPDIVNKTGKGGALAADLMVTLFGKLAWLLPLGMLLGASYPLLFQRQKAIMPKALALWASSFLLCLLGLTTFAAVLLPPTAQILPGGVLGEMIKLTMQDYAGQIGVLLLAIVMTSVGFYFCSGQTLIQLLTRLYRWVLGQETTTPSAEPTQPSEADPSAIHVSLNSIAEPAMPHTSSYSAQASSGLRNLAARLAERINQTSTTQEPQPAVLPPSAVFTPTPQTISPTSLLTSPDMAPPQTDSSPTYTTPTASPMMPPAWSQPQSDAAYPLSLTNVQEPTPSMPMSALEPNQNVPRVRLNPMDEVEPLSSTPLATPKPITPLNVSPVIPPHRPHAFEAPKEKYTPLDVATPPLPSTFTPTASLATPSAETATQAVTYTVETTEKKPQDLPPSTPLPSLKREEHLIHPFLHATAPMEKPTTPFPTLDLLQSSGSAPQEMDEQVILETAARIEQELANFGIKATVEDVLSGPVITRYEIKPAAGVKAAKITNLDRDLARALVFSAIRITEVVPGKPYMGIETPNPMRETVWLRDVLASEAFQQSTATLPMALGKDISGEPVVVDMEKMPHLLVAGETGGGKSVGLNSMILSLLYKRTPEQLRFIMIDPKMVELSIYHDIPHLLTPVVTDMKQAENALRWAVEEIDRRSLLFMNLHVRNISGYNEKIRLAEEGGRPIPNPIWRPGDTLDALPPPLEKLSYIVIIVDEFSDLMMSAGKPVEDHIMRITQKARAFGIYLILATQRPSTDVITGVIKANIPSRIAFKVASQIDSRTILDKGGAESLLGNGDMLYAQSGKEMIRVHGAFMTDDDVQRVADNWRARGKPNYIHHILESADEHEAGRERSHQALDPLFDSVTQYVIESGVTSISSIQRHFSLGFNRAARIVDQMEEQGIISGQDNRGKREVLAR